MLPKIHVYVFTRDLRADDNDGLFAARARALSDSAALMPLFVLDERQVGLGRNAYHSAAAVRFMLESLAGLARDVPALRLVPARSTVDALERVTARHGPPASVGMSADVTPFARARERDVAAWCESVGAAFHLDATNHFLFDPRAMDKPYQVFTPFFRRYAAAAAIPAPRRRPRGPPPRWEACADGIDAGDTGAIARLLAAHAAGAPPEPSVRGGRAAALAVVRAIRSGAFRRYDETRERPGDPHGTTRLSAALKFGCVSVREVYHAVVAAHGPGHGLVRELFWRAFYDQLAWFFPKLLDGQSARGNAPLRDSVDRRAGWRRPADAPEAWEAWCAGRTGFPFVDAGMRQLLATGWMHNRARMVTASFLTKQLGIDWREGERFFARHLVDYHPSSNSGGWQWASGVGADAQPYTRIFNPWLQGRRYDPEAAYAARFVPELRGAPPRQVLAWGELAAGERASAAPGYPAPCVDHSVAARAAAARYRSGPAAQ